jgi:hypothetical protein
MVLLFLPTWVATIGIYRQYNEIVRMGGPVKGGDSGHIGGTSPHDLPRTDENR